MCFVTTLYYRRNTCLPRLPLGGLQLDTKQIEYILKSRKKTISPKPRKNFYHPVGLKPAAFKAGKGAGTPLFHRSRANWRLTEAGEIYIEGAKAALQIKNTTYNKIYDVVSARKRPPDHRPDAGTRPAHVHRHLPELHRNYPNLDVRPIEMRVRAQQDAIARGEIDVGLMTLRPIDRTIDTYYPLKKKRNWCS